MTERIRILAGGGLIEGYAKYRDRQIANDDGTLDGMKYVQASVTATDMRLEQLGPILERDDVEGVASLTANVFGPLGGDVERGRRIGSEGVVAEEGPSALLALNGEGQLKVRRGRLGNVDLFRVILEAAKLVRTPARDSVDLNFRLEQGNLFANSFTAFVDGVEIRGSLEIGRLFGPAPSPLDGTVVVLLQPFAGFNLPFLAEATEILNAIQAQASALNLGGTLDKPRAVPASLSELGDTLGALLGVGAKD
jgi:hypothetical protein